DAVQRRQHVVTLAAAGSADTPACPAPHPAQERGEDEVAGIDEVELPAARVSLPQARFQLLGEEFGLRLAGLGGAGPGREWGWRRPCAASAPSAAGSVGPGSDRDGCRCAAG